MAVSRPDEPVEIVFLVGDSEYPAISRRGSIVHEAFHQALPPEIRSGHRLIFSTPAGEPLFADVFLGDLVDKLGATTIVTSVSPIEATAGIWTNIGADHLAIAVADRPGARSFFRDVVQMQVMRDDPHLTVLATGPTALFLFDAVSGAPLSTGEPSRWHHLGFVVDDLAAAYAHLLAHADQLTSDFTLLERDERWSLYFFYQNGDVTFMIQFSEIKPDERGFANSPMEGFPSMLYDYARRPYGVQWELQPPREAGDQDG